MIREKIAGSIKPRQSKQGMLHLGRLATLLVLLALWFVTSWVTNEPSLFPSPAAAAAGAVQMVGEGLLLDDFIASLKRVTSGFIFGSGIGVLLGILTGRLAFLNATIGQVMALLRPIPSIAIIPFIIIWVGIGEFGKLTIICWAAMFPTWIATHLGVVRSNIGFERVAQSCGASESQIIASVVIPNALPSIVIGLRTSLGASFVSLFAAEMVGGPNGIGYRIDVSHLSFQTDRMIVALICLAASGAAADALFTTVTKRLAPWINSSSRS